MRLAEQEGSFSAITLREGDLVTRLPAIASFRSAKSPRSLHNDLAAAKHHEVRDSLHPIPARDLGMGLRVDLQDDRPTGHFARDGADFRRRHPARTAPRRPQKSTSTGTLAWRTTASNVASSASTRLVDGRQRLLARPAAPFDPLNDRRERGSSLRIACISA